MKRIYTLLLFILASVAGVYAQPVKQNGQLKVIGTQLSNQHGKPIQLKGMSFGWHNWWPRFYNTETVSWLAKDWKCQVVRAAMGVEPQGAYLNRPEWSRQLINTVVEAAIREDIYVIIDWHSHNLNLEAARAFFTEMATRYGKFPHVLYEIVNEPDEETWPEVKAYSESLIASIRAIDPDNIILVGSPHWDQDLHLAAADPIRNQSNLMYTLHFYAATHKAELRNRAQAALNSGLPLFISESAGMEASGNGALDLSSWSDWLNWADKNKISCVTWSISDKDETCSVLLPTAASTGNWKPEHLKESGIQARKFIRAQATKP